MTPQITPIRLHLQKDTRLEIDWADGRHSVYPVSYLRAMCPCAQCRQARETQSREQAANIAARAEGKARKTTLNVLSGKQHLPLSAIAAERVGSYAIRLEWSDGHGSGIYSFQYLREISPA